MFFTEDIAKKGVRPVLNKQVPILDEIIVRCWQREPAKRPSFQELIPILQNARVYIFLPTSLCPDAGNFWKKKWLSLNRVTLEQFMVELFGYLKKPYGTTEHKCVAALFCPPEASASVNRVPQMSLTKFGKLLKWFGPLKQGKYTMLDHLLNTMKQPWFFGTINRQAAEAKLDPYKGTEGTFLVRLNTGAGEAIEVSPYTISRIEGGNFVHNRACPSKKGGFFIKAKSQIRADGSLQDLVQAILMHAESPCKVVCHGHPFEAIFSASGAAAKVGNYQMNDNEESD